MDSKKYLERNIVLQKQWGLKYINLIDMVIDNNNTMPVFTPECKFISQDCIHFTKSGAIYFAHLFEKNGLVKFER